MRRRSALVLPLAFLSLAACTAPDPMGARLAAEPVRVVFFEGDSAALEESAVAVLRDAAAAAARHPGAPVRVLGFAGLDDQSRAYNMALSAARAQHVASELARLGVPRGRIQVAARGPVPFEAVPVESRRVEIHIGGAP